MNDSKNEKININSQSLIVAKDFEKKFSKYFCGFAHNINSPLSGVISRIELLDFKLEKIKKAINNDNKELALLNIEKVKEEIVKMAEASEKVTNLMQEAQNFSSSMQEPDKTFFPIKGKIEELLSYLECDLFIKHRITPIIVDKLSKKLKNGYIYNFLKPIQYILEQISVFLPDTMTNHIIELTLHNDSENIYIDFETKCSENASFKEPNLTVNLFDFAEIIAKQQNGNLTINSKEKPENINLSLPL